MKKIAVLGSGVVGQVLADGFLKHGYEVMRGTREPEKLAAWKSGAGAHASVGTFAAAARFGELVVLAVKGGAAESAVGLCEGALAGKPVIDATNPIADAPPEHGVIKFFTGPNESLMEKLQAKVPGAHFVKAFSCVGNAWMVNPDFGGTKPTMFICGNDAGAKGAVLEILTQFGWETEDMGAAAAARAIEPLCMLWCIPGLTRNQWTHAFKLLKK
ncbi:MAG: NAD(P)-binding domain-containing protein [Polyangiaceae bacterium]|nr:NAD(P)-binding domain-containing protein [Polyangiaceae bacterium]